LRRCVDGGAGKGYYTPSDITSHLNTAFITSNLEALKELEQSETVSNAT
jgi:hypothetical protein